MQWFKRFLGKEQPRQIGTTPSWQCLKEFPKSGVSSVMNSVSWSPDGKSIASGSDRRTIWIWNARTGKEKSRIIENTDFYHAITCVAWSPDSTYIVSGSEGSSINIWEVFAGELIKHTDEVTSIRNLRNGISFVSEHKEENTSYSGKQIRSLTGHTESVNSVAWSPDSKYLVSGGRDHTVRIWNVNTGCEIRKLMHSYPVRSVVWSPNGKYLASSDSKTIKIWYSDTWSLKCEVIELNDTVNCIAWSPDSNHIVSGGSMYNVKILDINAEIEIKTMSITPYIKEMRLVYTGEKGIRIVDEMRVVPSTLNEMIYANTVNCVEWSPNGKYILAGLDQSGETIWEADTGERLGGGVILGIGNAIHSVAWSPNGKQMVAALGWSSGSLRIWEEK